MKMTILPNAIYRFSVIPIKWPMALFTELEQNIAPFVWKHITTLNSKSNTDKEQNWRHQLSWFQIILQSYSHQTVWYWQKTRNIDQWNKIESPELNPWTYEYFILDKGGKNIKWGKDSLFNKWCWENWTAMCKRMKL